MSPLLRSTVDKITLEQVSNFGIVEKKLSEIVQVLIQDDRLKKLLYYADSKALRLPSLNQEQTMSLLNNQIKIIPKLEIEEASNPYIILTFDHFFPDEEMNKIRHCTLGIDIICPYSLWILEDFKLRPYSMAGEIDILLNKEYNLNTGIGVFAGAKMLLIGPELGGLTVYYNIDIFGDDLIENDKN